MQLWRIVAARKMFERELLERRDYVCFLNRAFWGADIKDYG